MNEVLKEADGYRVVLMLDDAPEEPDDDGANPILRIDTGGAYNYAKAVHVDKGHMRPRDGDERVEEFARHLFSTHRNARALAILERALKYARGVTKVVTYWSDSYWYAAYDSAAFREAVGADEGGTDLTEYKAWIEGDVWGYSVEKQVRWRALERAYDGSPGYPDRTSWEPVEDEECWGYYGHEYAEEAALEAFSRVTEQEG